MKSMGIVKASSQTTYLFLITILDESWIISEQWIVFQQEKLIFNIINKYVFYIYYII